MRILKPVGYLLPAMVVSLVGAYAFLSRDVAATHPELTISALPDLIPAREFFANQNAEWAYLPSADGTMIAWYGVEWAKTVIHIRRTEEQKPFLTLSGEQFGDFRWDAFGGSLILAVEGRLWRVDVAHPERDRWVDITPRGFGSWRIITSPKTPEDQIVIASNDRDAALYDLYTVGQDGGGKQLLERNSGKTIDWWFDAKGVPRIRVDRVEHDAARYFIRREVDAPWRVLTEASARDNFELLFAPGNGDLIYALSDRGRDRIALTSVDAQTGEETVLADHPNVDARRSFTFASNATKPDFISFESSSREYRAFSSYGENFLKLMLDGDNPVDFSTLGSSADGRFVTVARSWREQSHEYFLYDLRDATATKIAEFDLRQYKNIFAETKAVSFQARDGLEIAAFLTLPHAVAPKNLPAIVLIHGGPASQTFWSFSEDVQFLANRGYAVLSVNFRGSTGYGKRFREAGYGQVGKAMQDDIVDAAKWLVAQGIADKDNMAVMGGSYGGYSAALAMTRDPGLFKAAITEYGVFDIAYQVQNNPFSWGLHLDEVKRYFGDADKPEELEDMRQRSPLTHASSVQGAILITAGKGDTVVGFEQSEEFERALKAAGKDVTAVYFEHEGHGYERWQTNIKRARLIEKFLAKHLGGRAGGFDYTDLAANYLN